MTPAEGAATDSQATIRGFHSTSDYLRHLVAVDGRKIAMEGAKRGTAR